MASFSDNATLFEVVEEISVDNKSQANRKPLIFESLRRDNIYLEYNEDDEFNSSCHGYLHRRLRKLFFNVGYRVALSPFGYVVISILLTVACMTGLHKMQVENDPEYLLTPRNSRAVADRDVIEKLFPVNYTNFDPVRTSRIEDVELLVFAKDNHTILREHIWSEVVTLYESILNITVDINGQRLNYVNFLCSKIDGDCIHNPVVDIAENIKFIEKGDLELFYPMSSIPNLSPSFFGGVAYNHKEGILKSAQGIALKFWLRRDNETLTIGGRLWEDALDTFIKTNVPKMLDVGLFIARSLHREIEANGNMVKPCTLILVFFTAIASALIVSTSDCVRSKPFVGFMGVVSIALAMGSAFGFLAHFGVPFTFINIAIPLLMLGIGLNDLFLVLSVWQRTKIQEEVPVRLGITYCEGVLPVTTTTLVLICSFCIGYATPIPSIQIFCLYCGLSVIFTYVWLVTLIGGVLALTGSMERRQKHCVTFKTILAKTEAEMMRWTFRWCCAGGINHADPWNPTDHQPHKLSSFFRDVLAPTLDTSEAKLMTACVYTLYIIGALGGCFMMKEDLTLDKLALDKSYLNNYYSLKNKYFTEFPYTIQIVIHDNLTYSDPNTMNSLLKLHSDLESLPHVGPAFLTQSWIRGFSRFLEDRPDIRSQIQDEETFNTFLTEEYLPQHSPEDLDVMYNMDRTRIVACRFLLQAQDIKEAFQNKHLMQSIQEILKRSGLEAIAFNRFFPLFEGYTDLRTTSVKSLCIAVISVMVITLLFYPNVTCALWTALSVISIEVGVLGYGALWGLNFDAVAIVSLLVSLGLSFHFSVHVSHAYLTAMADTSAERLGEVLFSLGLPLVQGVTCTFIAVAPLTVISSCAFRTVFRVAFLSATFGLSHSVIILPILLSLLGPGTHTQNEVRLLMERNETHQHEVAT